MLQCVQDWTSDDEDFEWDGDVEAGPVSATAPVIAAPGDAVTFSSKEVKMFLSDI